MSPWFRMWLEWKWLPRDWIISSPLHYSSRTSSPNLHLIRRVFSIQLASNQRLLGLGVPVLQDLVRGFSDHWPFYPWQDPFGARTKIVKRCDQRSGQNECEPIGGHFTYNIILVGDFKHFLFSIIYGMPSFPLTFIFVKMVIAPPSSFCWINMEIMEDFYVSTESLEPVGSGWRFQGKVEKIRRQILWIVWNHRIWVL